VSRRSRTAMLPARPGKERLLGGVCSGLSRAFAIDVTLVRLAFMVLILAWGTGLLLYVGLWLLMPDDDGQDTGDWRSTLRHRLYSARGDVHDLSDRLTAGWQTLDRNPRPRPLGRRWMAILLLSGGALVLMASVGAFSWITPLRAASLAMVVVGVGTLITMRT
jgi:phage shock protein C